MRVKAAWTIQLMILAAVVSPVLAADRAPATRPFVTIDPARQAVQVATAALSKEYASYLKDPKNTRLRVESAYFTDNPSPDLTPEAILSALEVNVPGVTNVSQQAYVKWQLLSGINGKIDDRLAGRLLQIYRRAPWPAVNPAMNHSRLEQAIVMISHDPKKADAINADLGQVLDASHSANAPIVAYRDALFAKLPVNKVSLAAGLDDAFERVRLGADTDGMSVQICDALKGWASGGAAPGDMRLMSDALKKLHDRAVDQSMQPYSGVSWNADDFQLEWSTTPVINDLNRLWDLSQDLLAESRR